MGSLISSLEGLISSLEGLISSLEGLISSLGGLISSLEGLISSLGGLISSLGGLISSLGGLISSLGGLISSLGGLISSLGGVDFEDRKPRSRTRPTRRRLYLSGFRSVSTPPQAVAAADDSRRHERVDRGASRPFRRPVHRLPRASGSPASSVLKCFDARRTSQTPVSRLWYSAGYGPGAPRSPGHARVR
jgi:hypothetical protein